MGGEADYLITHDDKYYALHSMGRRGLLNISGLFPIPVTYQTTRGYRQDGITILSSDLSTRNIAFVVKDSAHCREDYWLTRRYNLLEVLRMNRGGPLMYQKVLPTGARRRIDGWLSSGPTQQNDQGSPDAMTMQAAFSLLCPNPTFYDPTLNEYTVPVDDDLELVFPITFGGGGIVFGSGATFVGSITYNGTWKSYPVIKITGPYNFITIKNITANGEAAFTLSVPRGPGEVLFVYLEPGNQHIEDAFGNLLAEVPSSGNLIDWALLPDPLATDGANMITVSGGAIDSSSTEVIIQYYERFAAL